MFRVHSRDKFVKIDHDINIDAFKAAKESGKFDTAVLVSALEADPDSNLLYFSTKGKIERDLINLKFRRTIILRPGAILGKREVPKPFINNMSVLLGYVFRWFGLQNGLFPIYGEEVANIGYYLSQKPIKKDGEVIIVGPDELLKIVKEIKL
ncbi:unnamed protein product [Ambrosiozyma monospora]|uniref:Unnamed protein product n=1 Tax=Ambrosiozyma monospora TaxID=43982 RepID=A0ACB5U6W5_AMBMO|nr:unnamed protein product [Ambrosiozyma monospora]